MDWVLLGAALVVILLGAELFTNGVEWVGKGFGLSAGAVGSVLAAVGTALPETVLPFIAILFSSHASGEEIGVGAILGAPFLLTTLAMFVLGVTLLLPSRRRRRNRRALVGDAGVLRHDLAYFLVMYLLATVAGLLNFDPFNWALAVALLVGYVIYVRRHFAGTREEVIEEEAETEVRPLYLSRVAGRGDPTPSRVLSVVQTVVALVVIVIGAKFFVDSVGDLAELLGVPPLAFALLIAPLATELPEKFNSVIWVRRGKDTLALGNLTGAMVFQSSFPVTIGLLFTPWDLRHSPDALISAIVALVAGAMLYLTIRVLGRFPRGLLLLQGLLYAGFVAFVLVRL